MRKTVKVNTRKIQMQIFEVLGCWMFSRLLRIALLGNHILLIEEHLLI